MSFISIPLMTLPLPLSDIQALFVIETLTNPDILPSESEMHADTLQIMAKAAQEGVPSRHFHKLQKKMWDYLKDLIQFANLDVHISPGLEKLYDVAIDARLTKFANFREINYGMTENEIFRR